MAIAEQTPPTGGPKRELVWSAVDEALGEALPGSIDDHRWLLIQTIVSAAQRRALLGSLTVRPRQRVLDLGCGFGAATLELAALGELRVVGLDSDRDVLTAARRISETVGLRVGLPSGSTTFSSGDVYSIPFPNGSFDVVYSRFVFQHLEHPELAASEVARVLAPGGTACIVDVDDGLSISEPPPSAAFERLGSALRSLQTARGGDRYIGRRLAGLLDRHGMTPGAVIVIPQAAYHRPAPAGPERSLMLERLRSRRAEIIDGGYLSIDEFDSSLADFASEDPAPTCDIEAHLAVFATKHGAAVHADWSM